MQFEIKNKNMKKLKFVLPVLVAICLVCLFSQCEKDHNCKMKIVCHFSDNGIDTGAVAPKVFIKVGKDEYADYAKASGYTDNKGVFEHTFPYPALLDVVATYSDTTFDDSGNISSIKNYTGGAQVQVNAGETTEKTILMVETTL